MRAVNSLRSLRALMESEGLEGLLVTKIPNIRYLSRFTGSSAACMVSRRGCALFTDFRYALQAVREARGFRVVTVDSRDAFSAVAAAVRRMGLKSIGFESESLSHAAWRRLKDALGRGVRAVPVPPLVERLRMVKGPREIAIIKKAAGVTDRALKKCRRKIRAGMTESEIAWILECAAREEGAEEMAFPPIVASGPNGAMPHHRSGVRRVRRGEPLLIDFGIRIGGYNSDLTRVFQLGTLTQRYHAIYTEVIEAQRLALRLIRPGVRASEVDACARKRIASRGFGKFFGHALGHGVGLEVHEKPALNGGSRDVLEAGMVVTVEPGIYVPGWGGVRIEDMVLVREGGCAMLTESAKGTGASLL